MLLQGAPSRPASRAEQVLVGAGIAVVLAAYGVLGGAYDAVVWGQFAVGLWWLVGIAAACGLLPRGAVGRPGLPVLAAGALLVVLTLVSFTSTASDERTTTELARVVHHAGVVLAVLLVVRRETFVAALAGVLAGGALVCAVAVASRLAPGAFPADVVKEGFSSRRLSFPLDYWNATGAWAVMSAAVSVGLGSHLPQAAPRVVTASIAPLCVTCIYLAYSRAAVVGLVVALAVLWALSRNRGTLLVHVAATAVGGALVILVIRANGAIADGTGGAGGAGGGGVALALAAAMAVAGAVALATLRAGADQRLRLAPRVARRALGVAAVCLAVAAAIFAPDLASDAWDSFNEDQHFGLSDPAQRLSNLNGNRRNLYASALNAGRAHPWAGIGPGTFEFWWSEDARDPEFVRDAHSLYLEQFAELGWPGLAAVLGLVVALLAGAAVARRRLRTGAELGASAAALAAAAAFMVQAGVDWMWESTACAVLGLVVGACGVAAAAPPAHRPRRLWRAVVALLAVAAVLAQLPPLVSLSQVRASQDAFSLGRVETALAEAEDAVEAEPWAATPYVQRGLLAESRGALGPAVADLLRAERAEPTNWRHPLLLARLLAEQGDADGAVAAYRRARALRPLSERFRQR